jgi:hypothetical protein
MSPTTAWELRPREEANLLNPVFVALSMSRVAAGHQETIARGMPWALVFIALPAVLHQETSTRSPQAGSPSPCELHFGWVYRFAGLGWAAE